MNKELQLIVPTRLESELTGNYGSASLTYRGIDWRIDVQRDANNMIEALAYKRGAHMPWQDCPKGIRQAMTATFRLLSGAVPKAFV